MQITSSANLDRQFELSSQFSSPRLVAIANRACLELAKLRPGAVSSEGALHGVPRRLEHMTAAAGTCWLVAVEPMPSEPTGESHGAVGKRTAEEPAPARARKRKATSKRAEQDGH